MTGDLIHIGSKYLLGGGGGGAIQNTLEHSVWHVYLLENFVAQKVSCNNYMLSH